MLVKREDRARHQWHTPVILATWEAKIRKIVVHVQSGQKVHETPSQSIKVGCGGSCLSSQLLRKQK
jgi:hypothetical protein